MSARSSEGTPKTGVQVLCLGLPRTGTFSMYEALTILGYKNVHHGLSPASQGKGTNLAEWRVWSHACDASFPSLPTYTGRGLTRAEWDELFVDCEAVTDIASLFAEQLIEVYPDAKVVLVERDIEPWRVSIDEVFTGMYSPAATFFMTRIEPLLGTIAGPVSRRMWSGWLGLGDPDTTTLNEKRAAAGERYRRHYQRIKELVPTNKRLDFRLSQGWGPLCEFLEREVPDGVEFPRTNDKEAFREFLERAWKKGLWQAFTQLGPYVVGMSATRNESSCKAPQIPLVARNPSAVSQKLPPSTTMYVQLAPRRFDLNLAIFHTMNNFGVIEVASTKTTNAPGWAYVPDTGPALPNKTGAQSRKRARNTGANLSYADLTARQETKVRKELEVLDRDNSRDVVIPIPSRSGANSRTGGKHTPNVRKILQSQKTFANHLDDFIALGAGIDPAANTTTGGSSRSAAAAATAAISRVRTVGVPQRKPETPAAPSSGKQAAGKSEDVEMTDAPEPSSAYLQSYTGPLPTAHPSDSDPLLVSRVPPLPADEELKALMSAPPLSYIDAKAGWNDEDKRYPTRVFCEVCGYWGRIRCTKCGVRVCALECLETHREECVTRYGL
ncbi:SWR1 complex subunit vps71 [Seiridium cupressi]